MGETTLLCVLYVRPLKESLKGHPHDLGKRVNLIVSIIKG